MRNFVWKSILLLSLAAAAGIGPWLVSRGEGAVPAGPAPLDSDSLGRMLQSLGYTTAVSGAVQRVTFKEGEWSYYMNVGPSPNGQYIWLVFPLMAPPDPTNLPVDKITDMLVQSDRAAPSFFSYSPDNKMFYLQRPLQNRDITPEELRSHVEAIRATFKATTGTWDTAKWPKPAGTGGATPPSP